MQSLVTIVVALMALLPPQQGASKSTAMPDASAADMQSWVVDRFEKAASIALSPAEREKRSLRYAEILKRIAAGKSLSSRGLNQLIDEVAAVEKLAIDQLSLRYRVQVYSRFRAERAQYDRRMAIWRKMLSEWEAADTRAVDGTKILAWLSTSLERMRYDASAVLPVVPKFGEHERPQVAMPQRPLIDGSLPTLVPSRATVQHRTSVSPAVKLPVASQSLRSLTLPARLPTARSPLSALSPSPRIAHRVDKPPVPKITSPPRAAMGDIQPVIAPPESPRTFDEPDAEPHVMVDLNELSVRIRGYNLAIQELAGGLQNEKHWEAEKLSGSLDELTDLADRRAQLVLYRDLISRDEQQQVGTLLSLDAPVALLGAKIFAAREQLTAIDDGDSPALTALNDLSRKLATLAAKRAR